MSDIKLIALDLDGTLFDNQSKITPASLAEIRRVTALGVAVVISTGRPYCRVPFEQIRDSGIRYAITTNGSGVYDIAEDRCLFDGAMEPEIVLPVLHRLLTWDVHMNVFIDGRAYLPAPCMAPGQKLPLPESIMKNILNERILVEDIEGFICEKNCSVQKITLNFYPDEKGILTDREAVKEYLTSHPLVTCVSGGYNNLEFTKAGIDKGVGLQKLAEWLGIPMECTLAIGDTENDLAILEAAHIGIAMGNAEETVKLVADDITLSNTADGVAAALRKYIP